MIHTKPGDKMKKYFMPAVCGIITGVLNGLFGAGGGVVGVILLEKFMKMDAHASHSAIVAVILAITPVSVFFYLRNGVYDWNITWQAALGGVVGGVIGAKLLPKINEKWLHGIFGGFMIIAAARMLLH